MYYQIFTMHWKILIHGNLHVACSAGGFLVGEWWFISFECFIYRHLGFAKCQELGKGWGREGPHHFPLSHLSAWLPVPLPCLLFCTCPNPPRFSNPRWWLINTRWNIHLLLAQVPAQLGVRTLQAEWQSVRKHSLFEIVWFQKMSISTPRKVIAGNSKGKGVNVFSFSKICYNLY